MPPRPSLPSLLPRRRLAPVVMVVPMPPLCTAIAIAIAIAAAVTKRREVEALQLSDKVALCHAPKRQLA